MLRLTNLWLTIIALVATAQTAVGQAFPAPLSDTESREVESLIAAMKQDPRGPYLRIRWFCNDGAVLPPQGTPCRERGGGVQHAEMNERAQRFARLRVHVGTILQATPTDSLFDAAHGHFRLRELVLTQFLEEIDNGWVLRQARFYRGARQIEDEERSGQQHLETIITRPGWVADHFLLARLSAGAIPHVGVGDEQNTHAIRNLATEIAEIDEGFLRIRIKIHSFPSRDDIATVERYLQGRRQDEATRGKLTELRDRLRAYYDAARSAETLARYRRQLRGAFRDELTALEQAYRARQLDDVFALLADLAPRVRTSVATTPNGRQAALLMDLASSLHEQAIVVSQDLAMAWSAPAARTVRLDRVGRLIMLAHGAGYLSPRERDALTTARQRLTDNGGLTALDYRRSITYLGRSLDWASATVRATFGPVIQHYLGFEPRAAELIDALLRGSILLPLSQELDRLGADADRMLGTSHVLVDQDVNQGLRGLNPGVALRPLSVLHRLTDDVVGTHIYVLPETPPDLKPVAGVLTLDAGNLLSHVQLLARNLGIPNAAVRPELLEQLSALEGDSVFYAVSPLGRVILKRAHDVTADERALLADQQAVRTERVKLDLSRLRLDLRDPIPLTDLRAEHSGVAVGPKAANLGQLAAYFPTRVSAGVALPFGMFLAHVDRTYQSERTVLDDLREAYAEAGRMRVAGVSEPEVDQFMFAALAKVREAIQALEWVPEVRRAVVAAIRTTFGDRLRDGVFVRSDTNVEDLPQFSGAGLNLTVPHRRSLEDVLAAIKRVWTSPFTERAYLWRRQILDEQGDVYPSVLLLASVPSDKSGVLITSGLQFGGRDAMTVVAAEGVGGGVEGEDAETVVVRPDRSVVLLTQAKSPQRRVLVDSGQGGVAWRVAALPDVLLQPEEIAQLQAVVDEWRERFVAPGDDTVWDIEYGFVRGTLWLFQIRPFVGFRSSALLDRLRTLDIEQESRGGQAVDLHGVTP